MSYGRIALPRFYVDEVNWKISRGTNINKWSLIQGTLNTGSNVYDLIDTKPLNRCSFDTSANTTTHIILQWDTGITSSATVMDYVAILNHNLDEADGRVRVAYKATAFTGAGEGTSVANLTAVVNATVDTDVIDPSKNGSTIFTFDEVGANDGRYWAIEIEDDSNFSATDLEIGGIMLGEYYTMPHAPNMSVKRAIDYEGVKVQSSIGGGEFGNTNYLGGDDFSDNVFGQPFRNQGTSTHRRAGGRISYDLGFSFISDTDLMPSDMAHPYSADTAFIDIWLKTGGQLIPFIFSPDSTSIIGGDYLFARFNQKSFPATQKAVNLWDMSMKIRETW